jgi:hypothetical protein
MSTVDYSGGNMLRQFGRPKTTFPPKRKCSQCGGEFAPQMLYRFVAHEAKLNHPYRLFCETCRNAFLDRQARS